MQQVALKIGEIGLRQQPLLGSYFFLAELSAEELRQLGLGKRSARIVTQCGAIRLFRFAQVTLLLEQHHQRAETLDKVRPEFQGAAKGWQSLIEIALVLQNIAEEEVRVGVVPPQFDRAAAFRQGLKRFALLLQAVSQARQDVDVIGLKLERPPVAHRGVVELALLLQEVA